jgi:very-short-patch-repair endonuclease
MSELPSAFSRYVVDQATARLDYWTAYADRYHPCDSPIERLFLIAFLLVGQDSGGVIFGEPPDGYDGDDWFFIKEQEAVKQYRADFVIGLVEFPNAQRLVVECDGHDYHERTKDQAARDRQRDRQMQSEGLKVFRFTGSELYRDAIKCAGEVVSELYRIHYRNSP